MESVDRTWEWLDDDRLLFAHLSDMDYKSLRLMRQFREDGQFRETRADGGVDVLADFHRHVNSTRYQSDGFEPVGSGHIDHFENIRADFDEEQDKDELEAVIEKVRDAGKNAVDEDDLIEMIQDGRLDRDEAVALMESVGTDSTREMCEKYGVTIQQIHQHFYSPVLYLESSDETRFQNVIDVESEVGFLKSLLDYDEETGLFEEADWWRFSKLSERTDSVYIPYDGDQKFYPGFIFWVANGDTYHIAFVDPKSTNFPEKGRKKIQGYEEIFTSNGEPAEFSHNGMRVKVHLFLFNEQARIDEWGDQSNYWIHSISGLEHRILE